MLGFVIHGTLAPRHREAGLELVETEDFVELKHSSESEPIARFSATGVMVVEIIMEADKWLAKQKTK